MGEFLNRILTYLYCTKYNEINTFHPDSQKHVSHAGFTQKISDTLCAMFGNLWK